MTFQYFFFDTYIGYFLQALPIVLLVSAIYGVLRFRKDKEMPLLHKALSCIFVCYMAGLVCLVIGLDIMGIMWYKAIYQMNPGRTVRFFSGVFDLMPDFFHHINREVIGNLLMFLPFGILYPISHGSPSPRKTIAVGFLTVLLIEVLQPVVGRSFDLNDVILNTAGIIISAFLFELARRIVRKR